MLAVGGLFVLFRKRWLNINEGLQQNSSVCVIASTELHFTMLLLSTHLSLVPRGRT